ncbi:MAG: HEPN domain-containing protein [Actinobacteria bacterium]|nr:HEPN domain-containing protein [Actinomycetota bacterium]
MNKEKYASSIEWIRIARKDWIRIYNMMEKDDAEGAGFFLQQSLERYLKAFLLQHSWKLRKIHELDALLDEAIEYDSSLDIYRDLCEHVSGYYIADRYPPLGTLDLTGDDIRRNLEEAKKFINAMFPEEDLKI